MTIAEIFDRYFIATITGVILATILVSSPAVRLWGDQVLWRKIKIVSILFGFTSLIMFTLNIEKFWRSYSFSGYENKASEAYTNLRVDIIRDQFQICPGLSSDAISFCTKIAIIDKTISNFTISRPILIMLDAREFTDNDIKKRAQLIMKSIGDINIYTPDAFLGKPWLSNSDQNLVNIFAVLFLSLSFILATAEAIYQMMFARKAKMDAAAEDTAAANRLADYRAAADLEQLATKEADPTI